MFINIQGIRINLSMIVAYEITPGGNGSTFRVTTVNGEKIILGYNKTITDRLDHLLNVEIVQ